MTLVIDPETGLPQLPKDHFWQVERQRISIEVYAGKWDAWYDYDTNVLRAEEELVRLQENDDLRFETRTVEAEIKKRFHKPVKLYKTQFRVQYSKTVVETFVGEHFQYGRIVNEGSTDIIDASNLLTYATALYTEWQADLEAEKVYGNYPPKKLES
jgi:hypothetical protein